MSGAPTRQNPRWSEVGVPVAVPALIAGLPDISGMVWVNPPLLPSVPTIALRGAASVPTWLLFWPFSKVVLTMPSPAPMKLNEPLMVAGVPDVTLLERSIFPPSVLPVELFPAIKQLVNVAELEPTTRTPPVPSVLPLVEFPTIVVLITVWVVPTPANVSPPTAAPEPEVLLEIVQFVIVELGQLRKRAPWTAWVLLLKVDLMMFTVPLVAIIPLAPVVPVLFVKVQSVTVKFTVVLSGIRIQPPLTAVFPEKTQRFTVRSAVVLMAPPLPVSPAPETSPLVIVRSFKVKLAVGVKMRNWVATARVTVSDPAVGPLMVMATERLGNAARKLMVPVTPVALIVCGPAPAAMASTIACRSVPVPAFGAGSIPALSPVLLTVNVAFG